MLGRPRAFVEFFVFLAILGAVLAIGSRTLNSGIAFLLLGYFVVVSMIILWRTWKNRHNPQVNGFPSQLSVLPKRWQKWALGETDDEES